MQTFARNKVSLAVGTALLVMAGAAAAATPPVLRTTNPAVISATGVVSDANTRNLLSATGLSAQTVTVNVALSSGVVTAGIDGDIQAVAFGTPAVLITALDVADAALANRNVLVYTGTLGLTTVLPVTSATFVPGTATSGTANITVVLTAPVAPAAYRMNAGNLEYTADNTATTPTWNAVKIDVQAAAATGAIIYTENTGGTPAGVANVGYVAIEDQIMSVQTVSGTVKSSLAPTPTIKTATTAGATLVNGFVIDTGTPVALLAANLAVKTVANGAQTFPAAALSVSVCAASKCAVGFPGLGTVATAADFVAPVGTPDAADAAYYASANFNTGVTGGTVPFTVDGVNAAKASYAEVFNVADGLAAKLANFGGAAAGDSAAFPALNTITDGAAPALVSAQNSAGNLVLTFSEGLKFIGNNNVTTANAEDVREVAENVQLVGSSTDTLAALNLNAGGTLGVSNLNAGGTGALTITGILPADLAGKQVKVLKGLTVQEQDQNANFATTDVIETLGGVQTLNAVAVSNIEPISAAATAVTPLPPTLTFNDSTAGETSIIASAADNGSGKIASISVAFSKAVKLNTSPARTIADLANNLYITLWSSTGAPAPFRVYPAAADLTLSGDGKTLTINLPTAEIYSYLNTGGGAAPSLGTVTVTYQANVATVLTNVDAADVGLVVVAGNEKVKLPISLTATAASKTLLAQTVQGTFSTATVGDTVTGYLAEWVDAPKANAAVISVSAGSFDGQGYTIDTNALNSNVAYTLPNGTAGGNALAGTAQNTAIGQIASDQVNGAVAAKKPVAGVSNEVKEGKPGLVTVYLVPASDSNNTPTVFLERSQAENRASSLHWNIQNAAASAADRGSRATGADGSNFGQSNNNGNSYNNAGSISSSMAAGVAAALGQIANWSLPAFVVNAARDAATAKDATPASVAAAVLRQTNGIQSFIQTLSLDPVSGVLTNAATKKTGNMVLKNATNTTAGRGLNLIAGYPHGATKVVTGNKFNLLAGIDLPNTDVDAAKAKSYFWLLVHTSAASGNQTLLTSADPLAANFVPFVPDWFNTLGTATVMGTQNLALFRKVSPNLNTTWQLLGLGTLARVAKAPAGHTPSFPRTFVALNSGVPTSLWTNDGNGSDMALALAGNKTAVATELGTNKDTLSTLSLDTSVVKDAAALAWKNEANDSAKPMFLLQTNATTPAVKLPVGWSLVNVPSTGTLNAGTPSSTVGVQAVLRLGAQATTQSSWFVTDGGSPSVTAGEAVFVFSKSGGPL